MKRLPNFLTIFRIFLVPLFVVLMLEDSTINHYLAAIVFVAASLTDFFDGYLARRLGAVSDFGKLVDPLADKILVMAALVMLVAHQNPINGLPLVPGWIVIIILARDIWVTGLRALAASHGKVVPAIDSGKIKSFLQMVAIVCVLLGDIELPLGNVLLSLHVLGLYLLFLSLAFAVWSVFQYTEIVLKVMGYSVSEFIESAVFAGEREQSPQSPEIDSARGIQSRVHVSNDGHNAVDS